MCAVQGCDRASERRGYCDPHYRRVRKTGHPGSAAIRPIAAPVQVELPLPADENGCWIWIGVIRADGYGAWNSRPAHRAVWERLRGPIPDGLELDHLCRVIACVNPEHLEPVTGAENRRRAAAAQTRCKSGHEYDEANTYIRPSGHRDCRACIRDRARRYSARKAVAA